jgi:hypothetical protein
MATIKINRAQPVPLVRGPGIIAQSQAVLRVGMAKVDADLQVGGALASGLYAFGEQIRTTEAGIKAQNIEANYAVETADFLNRVNSGVDKDGKPNEYYGLSPEDLQSATEERQTEINNKYQEAITTVPDRATRGRLDANFIIANKELEIETQGVVNQKRVSQLQLEDQTRFGIELSNQNWDMAKDVTSNALAFGLIDGDAYAARIELINAEERDDYYIGVLGKVDPLTGAVLVTDEQAQNLILETFNDPLLKAGDDETMRERIISALDARDTISEKNYNDLQNSNNTAMYVNKPSREEVVQLLRDDQITDEAARTYIKMLDSDPAAVDSPSALNEIYSRMSKFRSGNLTETEVAKYISEEATAGNISQKTGLDLTGKLSGLLDSSFGGAVFNSIGRQGRQVILGVSNPETFDFDKSAKTSALQKLAVEFSGEMMQKQLDDPYFDAASWYKEAGPRYKALVEEVKVDIPDFPPNLEKYKQTIVNTRGAVSDDYDATAAVLRTELAAGNVKRKDVETAYKAMGLGDFTQ